MDNVDRYYLRKMTLFDLIDEDGGPSPLLDDITDEDMAIIKANTERHLHRTQQLITFAHGGSGGQVVRFERIINGTIS